MALSMNNYLVMDTSPAPPTMWDIETSVDDSINYNVSSQQAVIEGVTVSADGTKMYVSGSSPNSIFEYSLSTPWVASSATYSGNALAVGQTSVQNHQFSADGSNVYVISATTDAIYQFSLTTPWSLAAYSSVGNKSVSAEDNVPQGIIFNDDGTKMYMIGSQNDKIYEYDLSTAWLISSATYNSVFKSITTEQAAPQCLGANPNGLQFFVIGLSDEIHQYVLSTAWDLSTMTYDSKVYSLGTTVDTASSIFFKADGTKYFVTGEVSGPKVFQYSFN